MSQTEYLFFPHINSLVNQKKNHAKEVNQKKQICSRIPDTYKSVYQIETYQTWYSKNLDGEAEYRDVVIMIVSAKLVHHIREPLKGASVWKRSFDY